MQTFSVFCSRRCTMKDAGALDHRLRRRNQLRMGRMDADWETKCTYPLCPDGLTSLPHLRHPKLQKLL